jgi:hypothetical protein
MVTTVARGAAIAAWTWRGEEGGCGLCIGVIEPVTSPCAGRYEPMPGAPTAVPVEDAFLGGGGGSAAWVCGSGRDSTLPAGAAGPREIDPVTSPLREA